MQPKHYKLVLYSEDDALNFDAKEKATDGNLPISLIQEHLYALLCSFALVCTMGIPSAIASDSYNADRTFNTVLHQFLNGIAYLQIDLHHT